MCSYLVPTGSLSRVLLLLQEPLLPLGKMELGCLCFLRAKPRTYINTAVSPQQFLLSMYTHFPYPWLWLLYICTALKWTEAQDDTVNIRFICVRHLMWEKSQYFRGVSLSNIAMFQRGTLYCCGTSYKQHYSRVCIRGPNHTSVSTEKHWFKRSFCVWAHALQSLRYRCRGKCRLFWLQRYSF